MLLGFVIILGVGGWETLLASDVVEVDGEWHGADLARMNVWVDGFYSLELQ